MMLLTLLALSLVPIGATAQRDGCGSEFSVRTEQINTQGDLDALENECTILYSAFEISKDFNGPFVLPGVINASRLVGGFGQALTIPSFEMPDLEHAESLSLILDDLEEFSLPKLADTGSISLDISSHLDVLDFPALVETAFFNLKGNFTDVTFPELHTITSEMTLTNRRPTVPAETSMDISFPVLNLSSNIYIDGKVSRISLPELTTLTDSWRTVYGTYGSNFSVWGEPVSLDLPKLASVNGNIAFEGNFTSLSLPSLKDIEGNLTIIAAGNPLAIDIPLQSADTIELVGKIESVKLHLLGWKTLRVDTDLPFDCDKFMEEYDTLPPLRNTTCVSRYVATDDTEGSGEGETPNEDSAGEDEDDTGGNGALNMRRDVGITITASLVVAGLLGLLF